MWIVSKSKIELVSRFPSNPVEIHFLPDPKNSVWSSIFSQCKPIRLGRSPPVISPMSPVAQRIRSASTHSWYDVTQVNLFVNLTNHFIFFQVRNFSCWHVKVCCYRYPRWYFKSQMISSAAFMIDTYKSVERHFFLHIKFFHSYPQCRWCLCCLRDIFRS